MEKLSDVMSSLPVVELESDKNKGLQILEQMYGPYSEKRIQSLIYF